MSRPKISPFLRENFAPVNEEMTTQDLEIVGDLPSDLRGAYIRNGPNPRYEPGEAYHWFAGDGMLHAVNIGDGSASYRNRWVRGDQLAEEEEAGKELWIAGFRMGHDEPVKNSSNTHIIPVGKRALSLQEGGAPYEVDPISLETIGLNDFGGALAGSFTAHPKLDPVTGETVYFGWHPFRTRVDFGILNADCEITHKTDFELPVTTMMHDFCITEHYAIFFDAPLKYRLANVAKTGVPFSWEPENGTRIGVLPRGAEGSEIRWYDLPPFYLFHTGNAYEDGDEVVFTAARQQTTTFAGAVEVDRNQEGSVNSPKLHEWRLNLKTGACTDRELDAMGSEFPRTAPAVVGRPNRYTFGAHEVGPRGIQSAMYSGAFKYDHDHDEISEHLWGDGCYGGENVFVPRKDGTEEDDGWLVGFVYDTQSDGSQLRILDARDLNAGEVARINLPQRVPYGFHGDWFPSD
jgi:carotenoid cleavage dioxygenase-like enzyme